MAPLIRLVALPTDETNSNPLDASVFFEGFARAYEKLVREGSISCAYTGQTFANVRVPDSAIVDVRPLRYFLH